MTKKYLSQGVVLNTKGQDGVQNFDLENYVVSVLNKTETCCVRNIVATSITSTEGLRTAFIPDVAQNNIAAGGTTSAISITNYLTTINTDAGGDAFTLANGSTPGQLKKILLVVDGGGNATITLTGYVSIVMNDPTDYVILQWTGLVWKAIENFGAVLS
jgi:hypothetical protein